MKIILKEDESGTQCLFDTRSNQFIPGGRVRSSDTLLELANSVVRRPFRAIVEMAESFIYTDTGYTEAMIASRYLKLNPDIREKVLERINIKIDRKSSYTGKKRGRKPNPNKVEKVKVLDENGNPRRRGRPRKNPVPTQE